MVILIFKGPDIPGAHRRTVLRQILKNADYETRSLAQEQRASVEIWENEGGSTAGWPRCPIA